MAPDALIKLRDNKRKSKSILNTFIPSEHIIGDQIYRQGGYDSVSPIFEMSTWWRRGGSY